MGHTDVEYLDMVRSYILDMKSKGLAPVDCAEVFMRGAIVMTIGGSNMKKEQFLEITSERWDLLTDFAKKETLLPAPVDVPSGLKS